MRPAIILVILLPLLSAGCSSSRQDQTTGAMNKSDSTAPVSDNALSATESAAGWKLLFDGKSLTGWKGFNDGGTASWEVADGTLHCKAVIPEGVKRADLITTDQYKNFELAFDWKIAPAGNSGVMFHVTEAFDQPYATGPEYQIIDNEGYPDQLQPGQLTGANYDMHVPAAAAAKPVGQWNTTRIVVDGDLVQHWLNGMKVVEYEMHSADWDERRAKSKWKDFPGYGSAEEGFIALQDHGTEVWFKNIRIKGL